MSWADYANYLLAEGCCEEGGIVGTNGAIWAASPTFRLESYKVGIDNEGKEEQVDVDETKGLIEGTAFLLPPETYLQKMGSFPCFGPKETFGRIKELAKYSLEQLFLMVDSLNHPRPA